MDATWIYISIINLINFIRNKNNLIIRISNLGWKPSKHFKSLAEEDITPLSLNMFNSGADEIKEEEDDDEEEESDLDVMQEERRDLY